MFLTMIMSYSSVEIDAILETIMHVNKESELTAHNDSMIELLAHCTSD